MSQDDAILSIAAGVPDWLQYSVTDIPDPPREEPDKFQRISHILLENTSEEDYVKYYKPRLVSIGPIHCRNLDGQSMKDLKWKAMKQLAETVKDVVSIGEVYARVEEKLLGAGNRYSCDIIKSFPDDREWCKMMFLDGCFVVKFMYDYCLLSFGVGRGSFLNMKKYDTDTVLRDLLLYENQLPFEILDALADAFRCKEEFQQGLCEMLLEMPFMLTTSSVPARTFLDYIESPFRIKFRRARWGEMPFMLLFNPLQQLTEEARAPAHLLQCYLDLLIFFFENDGGDDDNDNIVIDHDDQRNLLGIFAGTEGAPRPLSTVTELKKVGIQCSGTTSLPGISFYSYMLSGKLFLPQLTFDLWRKTLILNLAAYEFSCNPKYRSSGISSYLSSIGTFIHREEDVKELRARGLVLLNHTDDDDHAVVDFFRYITAHHEPNPEVIERVKRQISTYCKSKRLLPLRVAYAEFYAEFTQRYFSGPWRFLVFLAVIFTVSMTLVQTVLTGIQTFKKD